MIAETSREMPVSAVARIVGIGEDSVWRILKHYVDSAREKIDLLDMDIMGIDEFSVEKHHVYDTKNSRVVDIEEGRESDVFSRFHMKHLFLDPNNIDHITTDMYLSYTSGTREYFSSSRIVDHFQVIKIINDALERIRTGMTGSNPVQKVS